MNTSRATHSATSPAPVGQVEPLSLTQAAHRRRVPSLGAAEHELPEAEVGGVREKHGNSHTHLPLHGRCNGGQPARAGEA
ncbi:hypothetical protein GCM10020219_081680 [Nonomuraea dietziae]